MSHFPSSHLVTPFDSAKSQPLTGQRLAKCRYKTTVKTPALHPSVCVSVPYLTPEQITPELARLMPHIRNMLENAQDGVIRSLYESADGTLTQVQDSELSVDSCIKYLEAESSGSRLTKEFIDSWFKGEPHDMVYALIVEKLHYAPKGEELTPEQDATVSKHVKGYGDMYSALAGGKTMYQPNQIQSLLKVLELIDTSEVTEKLTARLNSMLTKPKIEELLEL